MEIKGKRAAPNGMYSGNITIEGKLKVVMVDPIDENNYRAWTNSSLVVKRNKKMEVVSVIDGWTISKLKPGWAFKDMHKDEFTIFDW